MAKKVQGLNITGRLKKDNITIYERIGQQVMRSAHSNQPERRTHDQFVSRQKMHHSTNLWTLLKWAGTPMFPALPTAYARFLSLMHRTEVVFLPQNGRLDGATMLLPDIPLSEGSLPTVSNTLARLKAARRLSPT